MVVGRPTRDMIQKAIYLRLCYFNYNLYPQLKPPKLKNEIETWLKNDEKSSENEKFTWKQGWLTIDHIESPPCPYGSPKAHRGKYLRKDPYNLIEENTYVYVVRKPGQKNRHIYRESVFRLKRTPKARKTLQRLLGYSDLFWTSDYARLSFDEKEERIQVTIGHVRMALLIRQETGRFGLGDRAYIDAILQDLEVIKQEFEKERKNARVFSHSERENQRIEAKEKLNRLWTRLSEAPSVTGT